MRFSEMTRLEKLDYLQSQIRMWRRDVRLAQMTVDKRKNKKPTKKLLDAQEQLNGWQERLELFIEEELRIDLEIEDAIAKSS